jgi:hypothetical protein
MSGNGAPPLSQISSLTVLSGGVSYFFVKIFSPSAHTMTWHHVRLRDVHSEQRAAWHVTFFWDTCSHKKNAREGLLQTEILNGKRTPLSHLHRHRCCRQHVTNILCEVFTKTLYLECANLREDKACVCIKTTGMSVLISSASVRLWILSKY